MRQSCVFTLLVAVHMLLCAPVLAQEPAVVIDGSPIKKVVSSLEGTEQMGLTDKEQTALRVRITQVDNKFYWATRDNKELLHSRSGVYHDFVDPGGAGYIRVTLTEEGCLYMEHLTFTLMTITHWGIARTCTLGE